FEPIRYRSCGNHCIFCFVDQNPPHLRPTLYFKDEDFRLSFLFGSYVTLTNLSRRDAARIVAQRLSPLYVSIHAVNPTVRQKLLGLRKEDHLMKKLRFLTRHRIQIHAQIVLCPGINDGPVLEDTLQQLSQFYPWLNSVAIVPLGLTQHRQSLPELAPVTPALSQSLLDWGEKLTATFYQRWKCHWLYFADEFYLTATVRIPPARRYDDFVQLENGVGMTRHFLDEFRRRARHFPHHLPHPKKITLITGTLAAPMLIKFVLPVLARITNLSVNVVAVPNQFYGASVTVSGLLTGQDIAAALANIDAGDEVGLPPNCLNYDQLFLDDWTLADLEQRTGKKVKVLNNNFSNLF
ncbi:DUF512 domain-containing protein, partial [candidate division KSB1 bacterium]|nr:DUF512 domain-containing protein [candidate division KSB1 bacterium]